MIPVPNGTLFVMTEDVARELALMLENDQDDLKKFRAGTFTLKQMRDCAANRTSRLKEVFADTFPNIKNAGVQAYTAALTMVLHSGDHDLLEDYLKQHELQPEDSVNRSHRALLTDKILLLEGKPQRYGTQFIMKEGEPEILPLENLVQVDELRASLGLDSLEEYVRMISK